MSRELDKRDFGRKQVTPAREAELTSIASEYSASLPGEQQIRIEKFDTTTGNPRVIASEAAPAIKGNYIQRALDHLRATRSTLGFAETQSPEFKVDPTPLTTSSGAVAVHLQQQYKGIPILETTETVNFAPDGALQETVGSIITVDEDLEVKYKLSVEEAVGFAAKHVAEPHPDEKGAVDQFGEPLPLPSVDVSRFTPKIIAVFTDLPAQPTVLESGPFGDEIKASLTWIPIDERLRLAWEIILVMPEYQGMYRTIVDADTGEILYCKQLIVSVAARGNVYHVDGGGSRENTDSPRPLSDYGLPIPSNLPTSFPGSWVERDETIGNSTNVHPPNNGGPLKGQMQNGVITFNPSDATGNDQRILNAFYFCCYMHDFSYLLGFREADGNFQLDNFNLGGKASDRVETVVFPGAVSRTANMTTPPDGLAPRMQLGLVTQTNRHTALDSSVVFHEFTHGISNRLVGGPQDSFSLVQPQSRGMGEGWSDYIACTINHTTVVGAWVMDNAKGFRMFEYNSNFPDNFGHLGTGRYTEEHDIGEIWCATLMEMNRNIGANLGLQLVIDGFKLTRANPSFLDSRDAILKALDHMKDTNKLNQDEYIVARNGIRKAFAKFGMGPRASCNGAQLSGIVSDFNVD